MLNYTIVRRAIMQALASARTVRHTFREIAPVALGILFAQVLLLPALYAAQPASTARIGVLHQFAITTLIEGFRDGVHQAGYIEDTNIVIEWRRSTGAQEELGSLARDLAHSKVDLIVAIGSPATRAALRETALPVVFLVGDPVATGFAGSLAKPGGNGTGVSVLSPELEAKRLELLHQLAPRARRIGNLRNLSNPMAGSELDEVQRAARALGLQLHVLNAPNVGELDTALDAIGRSPPDALLVSPEAFFLAHSGKIAQAVRKARIPAIFPYREYQSDGALLSYGPDLKHIGHLIAGYVDRILRGAKPAELPVEQVSKYNLVVDLRVAREMGIQVPQDLLLRADEVVR